MYQGWREVQVSPETYEKFRVEKRLEWRDSLKANEFVVMTAADVNGELLGMVLRIYKRA